MKKLSLITLILFAAAGFAFSKNAHFSGDSYSISLEYNDSAAPGDAVFIRMQFETGKSKKKNSAVSALAEIKTDEKSAGRSEFYLLSQRRNFAEFLTGIPLSSWAKDGEYEIKINYTVGDEREKTFSIPLTVTKKEFPSGVITLTQNMSNISSNTSPEKVAQSKKLNDIINSRNKDSIFNLKKFSLPVTSKRRTTEFAERIIYKYPGGKESTTTHAGIDFGVPTGTQVTAPADGKVVLAENRIATGWTVIVEHLPGFYSMYYHCSELKVKVGQMVKQGDLLALSGATGFATGPHLHYEIRLNSMIVNPDFFLKDFAFSQQD